MFARIGIMLALKPRPRFGSLISELFLAGQHGGDVDPLAMQAEGGHKPVMTTSTIVETDRSVSGRPA